MNKRLMIIILSSTIALLLIVLIVYALNFSSNKEENKPHPLVLSEELMIPDGPQVKHDYNVSRQKKEKWDEEETQNWFTIPSSKTLEELSKANDALILDVIGAAP